MGDSSRASRAGNLSAAEVRRIQDEEAYPYIISKDIGTGSFAVVCKGYHSGTGKTVAIKIVSKSILTHKLLDNLESEISILKALTHKHITELTDIVKARKHIYLIMEFCSGGDLSKYIRHRGRIEGLEYAPQPGAAMQYWPHPKSGGLDPFIVRYFIVQLASALKFLRQRNLIHRDIKPQNILLAPSSPADTAIPHGVPLLKIADFGFARSLPEAALAETLCGSPLYMAPEILKYEKYDPKADLWSVGAVVYEMSVGRPPFRAQNHMELVRKIETTRGRVNFPDEVAAKEALKTVGLPSSPRSKDKDKEITIVPDDIKFAIRRLLQRKPVERATFEEFFDFEVVKSLIAPIDAEATKNAPPIPTGVPWNVNGSQSTPSSDSSGRELVVEERKHRSKRPDSKRSRSSKDRVRAETDSIPLEGTPYDPKFYVPKTALKFRRTDGEIEEENPDIVGLAAGPSQPYPGSSDNHGDVTPRNDTSPSGARPKPRRSSELAEHLAEAMITSKPEKEYVIVDAATAGSANEEKPWKRPSLSSRTTSTGVRGAVAAAHLTKQMGKMVIGAAIGTAVGSGGTPSPASARSPPTPVTPASPTQPIPITGRHPPSNMTIHTGTPPFAVPSSRRVSQGRMSVDVHNEEPRSLPSTPMTFPPATNPPMASSPPTPSPYGDGLPRSQPSALTRAINLASKKLWGSPTQHTQSHPNNSSPGSGSGSPRFVPQALGGNHTAEQKAKPDGVIKEAENHVLANVENVASKANVLRELADTKYAKVESTPARPIPSPAQFPRKKGEYPRTADTRRKAEMEAEQNALTAIALYLATMGFCQKGIDELNKYCEEHLDGVREPASEDAASGIDDALLWFRDTFKACMDRSELLKGWLPNGKENASIFIDRVIYDHALSLMKQAGSKELLEENFPLVQREYERALWMLYAIADNVIQEGNPYREQDVKTIDTFIEGTKTRLMRLKRRIELGDKPIPEGLVPPLSP